jgi:hypothetical protein
MKRGVILVHVLILVAMMGFMSALTLKWTMARHIAAKQSVESNENRALLAAAQSKVFTCLAQFTDFPNGTCKKPTISKDLNKPITFDGCLGAKSVDSRPYNYTICSRIAPDASIIPMPPCRVIISVCAAGDTSCAASCT